MGINDCITALREVFVCFRSALSCQKSTVLGQQNSSKRITTYCCNSLIKPKWSASESIEDIKRYSWAWMSGRCTSFSQQEWVLCHAKTTHLSINTLPTYGAVWHQKHDVIQTNSLSFADACNTPFQGQRYMYVTIGLWKLIQNVCEVESLPDYKTK